MLVLPLGSTCLRKFLYLCLSIVLTYITRSKEVRIEFRVLGTHCIVLTGCVTTCDCIGVSSCIFFEFLRQEHHQGKGKIMSCLCVERHGVRRRGSKARKSLTISHVKSSLLSASFSVSVPNVSWNHVGGVNEAKRALEKL